MTYTVPDEIIWRHVRDLPYFRAMVRACEDSFYQGLTLPSPVLDLGCGDAHFASVAFHHPIDIGLDPWSDPLREARNRNAYGMIIQSDGGRMPFTDRSIATVISNSVLEHIPHVDRVLEEVARVIQPGGRFVFCVPNHRFPQLLLGTQVFQSIGMQAASEAYTRLFQRISRHVHCDSPEVWKVRLSAVGFEIDDHWDYFNAQALHVMEAGHVFGAPALVSRKVTGRWILAKNHINLAIPFALAKKYMQQPISAEGVYSFYISHKIGE